MELFSVMQREFIYIRYYFLIQLRQIAPYWALGMVIGSMVSIFAKDATHNCFERLKDKKWGVWGVIPASILGIASPLCMYGPFQSRLLFPVTGCGIYNEQRIVKPTASFLQYGSG